MQFQTVVTPKEGNPKFAKFVQVEVTDEEYLDENGEKQVRQVEREIISDLPIGEHFNNGSGILFYINQCGLIPYDQYMAEKHKKEVAEKRDVIAEPEKSKGRK